jgi:hypothetical protein
LTCLVVILVSNSKKRILPSDGNILWWRAPVQEPPSALLAVPCLAGQANSGVAAVESQLASVPSVLRKATAVCQVGP